jgi:predicted transcriptional regulator
MTITCILPKEHQAWHTRAFLLTRLLEKATFTANKDNQKLTFTFKGSVLCQTVVKMLSKKVIKSHAQGNKN